MGNPGQQIKGAAKQVGGAAQAAYGDVKQNASEAADEAAKDAAKDRGRQQS
jgi:uncharacterized protein YjbJ (UPF0337 family)